MRGKGWHSPSDVEMERELFATILSASATGGPSDVESLRELIPELSPSLFERSSHRRLAEGITATWNPGNIVPVADLHEWLRKHFPNDAWGGSWARFLCALLLEDPDHLWQRGWFDPIQQREMVHRLARIAEARRIWWAAIHAISHLQSISSTADQGVALNAAYRRLEQVVRQRARSGMQRKSIPLHTFTVGGA